MDAGAKRIVHFINDALHEAHALVRRDIPDFRTFKKQVKKRVTGVELSTDSDGNRTVAIGVKNGGANIIEVAEPGIITPELRREFRALILEVFRHTRA